MVLAYVVFKINASFIGYIEFVKLNCSSGKINLDFHFCLKSTGDIFYPIYSYIFFTILLL